MLMYKNTVLSTEHAVFYISPAIIITMHIKAKLL